MIYFWIYLAIGAIIAYAGSVGGGPRFARLPSRKLGLWNFLVILTWPAWVVVNVLASLFLVLFGRDE